MKIKHTRQCMAWKWASSFWHFRKKSWPASIQNPIKKAHTIKSLLWKKEFRAIVDPSVSESESWKKIYRKNLNSDINRKMVFWHIWNLQESHLDRISWQTQIKKNSFLPLFFHINWVIKSKSCSFGVKNFDFKTLCFKGRRNVSDSEYSWDMLVKHTLLWWNSKGQKRFFGYQNVCFKTCWFFVFVLVFLEKKCVENEVLEWKTKTCMKLCVS